MIFRISLGAKRANFHSGKRCDEDIIKHIASDIRDQHRLRTERKLELSKLKDTFDRLNTKVCFWPRQSLV